TPPGSRRVPATPELGPALGTEDRDGDRAEPDPHAAQDLKDERLFSAVPSTWPERPAAIRPPALRAAHSASAAQRQIPPAPAALRPPASRHASGTAPARQQEARSRG